MTPRRRMSEKERTYIFALLFPPLWPFAIAMMLSDLCVAIGDGCRSLWRRLRGERDERTICTVCGARHHPVEDCDLR